MWRGRTERKVVPRRQEAGKSRTAGVIRFVTCALIWAFSVPVQAEQASKIPQVGFLVASKSAVNAPRVAAFQNGLRELESAAETLKVKLDKIDVLNRKDIDAAFQTARKEGDEAVLVLGSPVINSQRKQVADLAIKHQLPTIYYTLEMVEEGGLIAYGVNRNDLARRAATYVDKILKGAKPADLPVEQPTKFELVINLNAAKQIGLVIPPNVLARADKVIR